MKALARLFYAAVIALVTACAAGPMDAPLRDAIAGQAADVVSTGVALSVVETATETNPLGAGLLALKPGLVWWANTLPEPGRSQTLRGLAATGWGPAVNNVCIALGGANPVCLTLGLAAGVWRWFNPATDARSEFAAACAREQAANPQLVCTYTP
jgi:hypothetical protein